MYNFKAFYFLYRDIEEKNIKLGMENFLMGFENDFGILSDFSFKTAETFYGVTF